MDLEAKKEALLAEISATEEAISAKTAELDEVRKLLNKEEIEKKYSEEYDDEDFEDDSEEEEMGDEDEEGMEDEEDFVPDEEDADEDGDAELIAKEAAISEEVLVLQMRLVALNKQLNDILASQGTDNLAVREE